MLNEILLHILNNYPTEKGKSSHNDPLATYFRQDFKKTLQELVDTNIFKINADYDFNKRWIEIPVVSILNKKITNSKSTGFYVAYIFNKDKSSVYLSLTFGYDAYKLKYGSSFKDKLYPIIFGFRNEIKNNFGNEFLKDITNVGDYENANIISKEYTKKDLESKYLNLEKDLNEFIEIYNFLIDYVLDIPEDIWNDLILKDNIVFYDDMLEALYLILESGGSISLNDLCISKDGEISDLFISKYIKLFNKTGDKIVEKLGKLDLIDHNGFSKNSLYIFEENYKEDSHEDFEEGNIVFKIRDNLREFLEKHEFDDLINERTPISLKQDADFFDCLSKKGYYFDTELVENFLLSLKVKPFVILTGNSGTGKTQLALLFAKFLTQNLIGKDQYYQIVPVGSNWTDNRNILGFYNVITKKYQHTAAYDLIINANMNPNIPHFLILDEMNLSHVERYFADFLSAIESHEDIPLNGAKDSLPIPKNLFVIGTVNIDETTYMFSPKVLDRANTIEFKTVSAEDYMKKNKPEYDKSGDLEYLYNPLSDSNLNKYKILDLKKELEEIDIQVEKIVKNQEGDENIIETKKLWDELTTELTTLQEILCPSGFDFGFRVINEILKFMLVAYKYNDQEEFDWKRYFDAAIKQKILPKIHGTEKSLKETINKLIEFCEDYPTSKEKLEEMKKVLHDQKFVSFIN